MNLRYFWRSVSLVLVLWFALFPTLSYASETVTNDTYTYDWREAERELLEYSYTTGSSLYTVDKDDVANGLVQGTIKLASMSPWGWKYIGNPFTWISPLEVPVTEFSSGYSSYDSLLTGEYKNGLKFFISLDCVDRDILIDKGDSVNLKLNGLKHQMKYNYTWKWSSGSGGGSGGGSAYYPLDFNKINTLEVELKASNGETVVQTFSGSDIQNYLTVNGDTFGIDIDFVAELDVKVINVVFSFPLSAYNWSIPDASSYHSGATHYAGTGIFFQTNIYNGVLKITTPDETSGLLSGIIEWLRSIRDGIVNVANYVLELPSRIWTFIQEGLKMLFIPSESDITDMHSQWDNLMRDRFGAIYEAGDIVHQFGQTVQTSAIMAVDSGGVIELPSATVNLVGVPFTFGGYTVDIIPAGFEFLSNAVKTIVNIICTVIFLNMLRNKLEELIR